MNITTCRGLPSEVCGPAGVEGQAPGGSEGAIRPWSLTLHWNMAQDLGQQRLGQQALAKGPFNAKGANCSMVVRHEVGVLQLCS